MVFPVTASHTIGTLVAALVAYTIILPLLIDNPLLQYSDANTPSPKSPASLLAPADDLKT